MFTDVREQFYREGLQQGSTHILRHLAPSKRELKKLRRRERLGFAIPTKPTRKTR